MLKTELELDRGAHNNARLATYHPEEPVSYAL